MTSDEILNHFRRTNALLDGHFVLSSGRHSPAYLQCALALQQPVDALRFGQEIARRVSEPEKIDTVASPAIGGLVIGLETASSLGKRFIWTEREAGAMSLRRGFTLTAAERILVVEDVITTGGSTRECIAALQKGGGEVVSAASIIDRSAGAADVGVPRISLGSVDVPSYSPDECPLCIAGTPAVKPGSRTIYP